MNQFGASSCCASGSAAQPSPSTQVRVHVAQIEHRPRFRRQLVRSIDELDGMDGVAVGREQDADQRQRFGIARIERDRSCRGRDECGVAAVVLHASQSQRAPARSALSNRNALSHGRVGAVQRLAVTLVKHVLVDEHHRHAGPCFAQARPPIDEALEAGEGLRKQAGSAARRNADSVSHNRAARA